MAYTFSDLVSEVKRRATRDQGGTTFDTEIKLAINTSLFRTCREALWRQLRRTSVFNTETSYTTGTGAVTVTNASGNVTVTGATFITDNIRVGRRVSLGGSQKRLKIGTITGETTFTLADSQTYDGTTSSTQSYKIYGTEQYNLPIQSGRIGFVWHEKLGYPWVLDYITDKEFFDQSIDIVTEDTPTCYRMWGDDSILRQPNSASVMRIVSSTSADTSKPVTVFGTVSGYPDYEIITTDASNGTTAVSGSKSFSSVERIVKDGVTTGRITVDSNSTNVTVAVIPVGDSTGQIIYKKMDVFPLPNSIFPINVQYYKDVWRLVNDGDIHELGGDFDEAIILLATTKLNYSQNKSEGDKYFLMYKDEIKSLKRFNVDRNLDWSGRLKRPREGRPSSTFLNRNVSLRQVGGQYGLAN